MIIIILFGDFQLINIALSIINNVNLINNNVMMSRQAWQSSHCYLDLVLILYFFLGIVSICQTQEKYQQILRQQSCLSLFS